MRRDAMSCGRARGRFRYRYRCSTVGRETVHSSRRSLASHDSVGGSLVALYRKAGSERGTPIFMRAGLVQRGLVLPETAFNHGGGLRFRQASVWG